MTDEALKSSLSALRESIVEFKENVSAVIITLVTGKEIVIREADIDLSSCKEKVENPFLELCGMNEDFGEDGVFWYFGKGYDGNDRTPFLRRIAVEHIVMLDVIWDEPDRKVEVL